MHCSHGDPNRKDRLSGTPHQQRDPASGCIGLPGSPICLATYRGKKAGDLRLDVKWIGFWFNIPGVTLDPTKVSNDFFNAGTDVLMPGIDTNEALVQVGTWKKAFEWAAPDWKDINNPDVSAVSFLPGPAMTGEIKKKVNEFIRGMADDKINLYQGPLKFQDGSVFQTCGFPSCSDVK